ncbi:MAG: MCP four helix bundle domain-containing protein [Nitrospirae bacterium]|nr:MCP four helix bundle domain-containing protein [Nitrospirota bacterium]
MFNLKIGVRLCLLVAFMAVILVGIGTYSLNSLSASNAIIKTVYEDSVVTMGQIAEMARLNSFNRVDILAALEDPRPEVITQRTANVEENIKKINDLWKEFTSASLTPEGKVLADKFAEDRRKLTEDGFLPMIAALRANKIEEARKIKADHLVPNSKPLIEDSRNIIQLQKDVAKALYDKSQKDYSLIRNISVSSIIVGMLFSIIFAWWIINSVIMR